jgi:hypothetical protein
MTCGVDRGDVFDREDRSLSDDKSMSVVQSLSFRETDTGCTFALSMSDGGVVKEDANSSD